MLAVRREGEFSMAEAISLKEDHLVGVRETLGGGDEVTTGPWREREGGREGGRGKEVGRERGRK